MAWPSCEIWLFLAATIQHVKKNWDPRWCETFSVYTGGTPHQWEAICWSSAKCLLKLKAWHAASQCNAVSSQNCISFLKYETGSMVFILSWSLVFTSPVILSLYTCLHFNEYDNLRFSTLSSCKQETLVYVDINLSGVLSNKRINEKYHLIGSRNGRIQIELQWRTPWWWLLPVTQKFFPLCIIL